MPVMEFNVGDEGYGVHVMAEMGTMSYFNVCHVPDGMGEWAIIACISPGFCHSIF